MSIDLAKLIADKTYVVPGKSVDLCTRVFAQLNVNDDWTISVERPRSAIFRVNWEERYVLSSLSGKQMKDKERVTAAARKKFNANRHLCTVALQERTVDNYPAEVSYIVAEDRADGCAVKAASKPMLYINIVRGNKHGQPDLQDVRIQGEEFLDQIFIGGLRGKEIQEVKQVSRWELLFNDTHVRQITDRINEMLSKAATCVLFFGWFGTEFIPKFKELKEAGLTIRAITHKPAERKAPVPEEMQKGFAELAKLLGLDNVSVNPLVHGRAIIVDNKALVGSMDLNAFSLSGEHVEFAIYTEDPSTVRRLKAYFDQTFKPLKEQSS
jgi:hypothetical protein